MLRTGSGEPLLLLHGILCSERVWSKVTPLLCPHREVIAPTLLGHRGGPPTTAREVRLGHLVDELERLLDSLGIGRAHIAGNSLGGWIAIELARRDRALTIYALSPAGAWDFSSSDAAKRPGILLAAIRDARRSRPLLALPATSRRFRRWALRNTALHGERVGRPEFLDLTDDMLGCEIAEDLLHSTEQLEPLDPSPCPITIAWSAADRIFPVQVNGTRARKLLPGARFIVLDDVGHVPMLDDPQLVASTILAAARSD